jgi:hypothetical protein
MKFIGDPNSGFHYNNGIGHQIEGKNYHNLNLEFKSLDISLEKCCRLNTTISNKPVKRNKEEPPFYERHPPDTLD